MNWEEPHQFLIGLAFLLSSVLFMICVAVVGFLVALLCRIFSIEIDASQKQSAAKTHGGRSGPCASWGEDCDWDGREETPRDGEQA